MKKTTECPAERAVYFLGGKWKIRILFNLSQKNKDNYIELCNLLKKFHGKCPVIIEYESGSSSGRIPLSKDFNVSLNRNLLDSIEELLGHGKYKINYWKLSKILRFKSF